MMRDQCHGTTKSGNRCSLMTIKYPKYCHIHTKSNCKLKLAKSSVPQAGTGLYSMKEIDTGDKIAEYKGDRVPASQHNRPENDNDYGIETDDGRTVIDGASTQSTIARYANDCRPTNKRSHHCPGNNAEFKTDARDNQRIFLKAKEPIHRGEEIFVSYGPGYWDDPSDNNPVKRPVKNKSSRPRNRNPAVNRKKRIPRQNKRIPRGKHSS